MAAQHWVTFTFSLLEPHLLKIKQASQIIRAQKTFFFLVASQALYFFLHRFFFFSQYTNPFYPFTFLSLTFFPLPPFFSCSFFPYPSVSFPFFSSSFLKSLSISATLLVAPLPLYFVFLSPANHIATTLLCLLSPANHIKLLAVDATIDKRKVLPLSQSCVRNITGFCW